MNHATVGDLKISKELPKGNRSDFRSLLAFALVLAGWGSLASAMPVSIAWEVPLARTEVYNLEIAKDAGFSQTTVSQRVRGTGIIWNAKEEGVYHWRLTRPNQKGAEASSFVSGSFVAIDGAAMRAKPARVTWDPVPGADRYKLYVADESGKTSTIIVQTNSFILPKSETSQTVEVVPYSGDLRTFRTYHFNPSLKIDTGVPPPPPPAPAVEQPPVTAPPPAAAVAEATPGAKPDAPPPVEALPDEPGNRRVHLVYLFGLYENEELRLQKLEVDLVSEKKSGGEGAGLWINPVKGLIVSAQGSYHEHNDRVTQDEIFGDEEIEVYQARYSADLTVGYNILDFWDVKSQVLSFGVSAAAAQLPFLPLEFSSATGDLPKLTKKPLSLFGGSASYGYLGTKMAAVLEGGLMVDKTDDATFGYQRLVFDFYPVGKLSLQLGLFNRFTQASRCAPDSGTCLLEGKVTTTSQEKGGFLGLGVVLF